MNVEQNPRLSDEVRHFALLFYNYLFYGLGGVSPLYLGLLNFNKEPFTRSDENLWRLFLEGEPTVCKLWLPKLGHNSVPQTTADERPVGYEVYLLHSGLGRGRDVLRSEGVKYTVYHEGSAFVEKAVYRQFQAAQCCPVDNFVVTEKLLEPERPLRSRDLQQFRAVARHIRSIHEKGAPIDYKERVRIATLRGVDWET